MVNRGAIWSMSLGSTTLPFLIMIRTIGTCEKNITPVPANAIVVPAGVSKEVIPDGSGKPTERAYATIQNVGANIAYYAFGQTCDNVSNFHGVLPQYSAVPIPSADQVTVFSPAGTTIAVTIFTRDEGI